MQPFLFCTMVRGYLSAGVTPWALGVHYSFVDINLSVLHLGFFHIDDGLPMFYPDVRQVLVVLSVCDVVFLVGAFPLVLHS